LPAAGKVAALESHGTIGESGNGLAGDLDLDNAAMNVKIRYEAKPPSRGNIQREYC
jgi:hypothetical protein